MKVRLKKCSNPKLWYYNLKQFECEVVEDRNLYRIISGKHERNYLHKDDFEITGESWTANSTAPDLFEHRKQYEIKKDRLLSKNTIENVADDSRGARYNSGKLRYDLIHPKAQEGLVKVLTAGSVKYSPRNWEKGMPWTEVIASSKRHLAAIERGEDYDEESGLLHADHLQCNSHFLSAYYKIAPQFDDRNHSYLTTKRIALDIDEVICDFTKGWAKLHGIDERPNSWNYHRAMLEEFEKMKSNGSLDEFYMFLEPKINPNDIPFEPVAYVTSRPVDTKITEAWLDMHKFPTTKVITVGVGENKAQVLKDNKIDIFVDDGWHNFVQLNKAGICTYLFDAPHNRRYDCGFKRIYSLKELL